MMGGGARIIEWRDGENIPPLPNKNFSTYILEGIKEFGEKEAVIDALTKDSISYSRICYEVPRVAGGLMKGGVKKGDKILLITPSHLDYTVSLLATIYNGAVCVPLSASINSEELARAFKISEARFAFYHDSTEDSLKGACTLLPGGTLKGSWRLSREEGPAPSLASLLKGPAVPACNVDGRASETPALLLFSSGTTGLPKGVLLSHTSILSPQACNTYLLELVKAALGDDVPPPSTLYARMLLMLPLYHVYGFTVMFLALKIGCTSVLLSAFKPKLFFDTIKEFEITVCPLVPHIASFLAHAPSGQHDLSSLKALSSAAAPLSSNTVDLVEEKLGLSISNGYGMTEAVNIASNGSLFGFASGAVGKVMPYMKVKIIDVNTGEMLGEGEEGEVCIKGATMMMKYINNKQATEETIDASGWLHTGDIGYYNEDDFLFLTDRIKDLIKVKAFQVSPKEIEDIILSLDGVMEAGVIGVPDARSGEAVRAYVVLTPSSNLTPHHIKEAVAEHVSSAHKHLSGGVEVVNELPRNATGKLLRKALKENYMASRAKL